MSKQSPQPQSQFTAMLSYARVDREWVEVLHRHLETLLPKWDPSARKVFIDTLDIPVGRSWVAKLEEAVANSDRVILVATPESLASPWVRNERQAFLAEQEDWLHRGKILVVGLRPVELPPFLKAAQYVDFTDHDHEKYRKGLLALLAALLEIDCPADLGALPADLQTPTFFPDPLGTDARRRVEGWLTALLSQHFASDAVVERDLLRKPDFLRGFPTPGTRSSATVVMATQGANEPRAALRVALLRLRDKNTGLPADLASDLAPLLEELAAPPPVVGLPAAVAAWREHVARDCRDLEAAGPGDPRRRPLETIYVELRVSQRPGEAPDEADPRALARRAAAKGEGGEGDPGRKRMEHLLLPTHAAGAEDPAPQDADPARRRSRGWVVLGDPGAGKTTLLRHLARYFATRPSLDLLPVFVSLPQVMAGPGWFLDQLQSRARKLGARGDLADALDRAGRDADPVPLVILADGLDEISRERRGDARDWLLALADRLPAARVVVSSRPVPYVSLRDDGFEEVVIQSLDEEARVDLVANHLAAGDEPTEEERDRAAGHVERLRRDAWLWEWAGNPLYLGFLALLLREGVEPSRIRPELYRQVLDLMLRCQHRPGTPGVDAPGAVRELLSVLAYRLTDGNETEVHQEWLERQVEAADEEMAAVLTRLANASGRYGARRLTVFADIERTGVLAPYAKPDWRFLHRTFREALAAEHLARQARTKEGMAQVLARARALGERSGDLEEHQRQAADQTRWAEPFALLAGQVEDRDGLVTALVGANRDLGLRALASTHDLRRETVVGLLKDVEPNHDRAQVIRSLPQVLARLDEVLDLADELRRGTRNGDDLFWLDWVVREVARRATAKGGSALASRATALLANFFDHVPAPPAEVFREVETGPDGTVPLWCDIPPGEFLMGSPESEEGRDDDEGPLHRVEIKSGFHMAAVPVTRVQYEAFDPDHQSYGFDGVAEEELAHHPVNSVTWWAAMAFCRWLAQVFPETAGARLPSEAEWEYACRAGRQTAYWSGGDEKDLDRVGWFDENSKNRTHRVGGKPANPWGLYDVHGNVWEWTLSRAYSDYSERAPGAVENPKAVSLRDEIGDDPGGGGRVIRGGSYASDARFARSAFRVGDHPWYEFGSFGFRVLLPAAPSDGS